MRLFCSGVTLLPCRSSIRLGKAAGQLTSRVLKERTAIAHGNLRTAFGETLSQPEREKIIRSLFRLLGESLIESLIFTREDVQNNIRIQGMEHLDAALSKGRGAIILAPHMGAWELASYALGLHVEHASTVYKPLKNPFVNNYLIRNREKIVHLNLIPSRNALRMILQKLRKGYMIVMLFDQNAGKNGLPATFFGKTAFTYSAPALFAMKTGCPVIPGYIMKEPEFRRHRITINEPFPVLDTGNRDRDILANTQQYNDFFEGLVRKHPDQWFGWLHRRWKVPRAFSVKTGSAAR